MKFGKIDKIIFFGGGKLLSELCLKCKHEAGFELIVVTSKRHYDETIIESENICFKDFLKRNKIKSIISENINKDKKALKEITKTSLGISVGAAWIFREKLIHIFQGKLLNLHATRLPQDRGGGGFSWRILRNERLGFSVIHKLDSSIDNGPIVLHREFFYPQSCKLPNDYEEYLIQNYLMLFDEFIDSIKKNKEFTPISQPEYLSTYWPRLYTNVHGYIDWNWKLKDIEQFICAFDDPYKGAITFIGETKVRLKKCFSIVNDGCFHPFQKGIVYRIGTDALFVATEQGGLVIRDVTDEKGINIIQRIKVGDRFYTPSEYLENAKKYRAVYSPEGLKK